MEQDEKKQLGAIDALSAGFELVIHHPWMLLIPIGLDLFLWLGPQIHAQAIFDQMLQVWATNAPQASTPDTLQMWESFKANTRTLGQQFNVFSLLALGLPTITPLTDTPALLKPLILFSISDPAGFLGWAILFSLAGLVLSTVYLEGIARAVRHETGGLGAALVRLARAYANVFLLVFVLGVGAVILMFPFISAAMVLSSMSPGLAAFFLLAIWMIVMWAGLYMTFAIPAIFTSGANPRQAIINSIAVFRYNFWPAMGLAFLVLVIWMGFSLIWQQMAGTAAGLVTAMIANAVLGTSLLAALMLFYYDRFTWLSEVRDRIRRQHRPSFKG